MLNIMTDTTSGDPMQVGDVQVVGAGETVKEPAKQAEPSKGDEPKEGVSSKETTPPDDTGDALKDAKKKAESAHRQVIDLIDEKFKMLQDNRLDDQELRKWFLDHPEFADTANRSKRVKDKFRTLMERSAEVRRGEKKVEEAPEEEQTDDAEEEKKSLSGDRPVTAAELKKLLDDREEHLMEKTLVKDREEKAEDYAVRHNIVDDEYDSLKRNADALFDANDDWTYEKALEAAYTAINVLKGKPLNVVTPNAIKQDSNKREDRVDLTKPTPLVTWEEFSGNKK